MGDVKRGESILSLEGSVIVGSDSWLFNVGVEFLQGDCFLDHSSVCLSGSESSLLPGIFIFFLAKGFT